MLSRHHYVLCSANVSRWPVVSCTSSCPQSELEPTGPTQRSLPSKLNRPPFHLCLLGVALPICVEFCLQLGNLGLKLVEMPERGVAFCLGDEPSVSQTRVIRVEE